MNTFRTRFLRAMTELRSLPTTDSGAVRKADAMKWLEGIDEPDESELITSVTPKPTSHSGSTHATPISNIRVTGEPEFIEKFAGFLKPFLELENEDTRLELSVQQIENRDTGELTNNYALYLNVAERG